MIWWHSFVVSQSACAAFYEAREDVLFVLFDWLEQPVLFQPINSDTAISMDGVQVTEHTFIDFKVQIHPNTSQFSTGQVQSFQ